VKYIFSQSLQVDAGVAEGLKRKEMCDIEGQQLQHQWQQAQGKELAA